jgi:hypothetical protein
MHFDRWMIGCINLSFVDLSVLENHGFVYSSAPTGMFSSRYEVFYEAFNVWSQNAIRDYVTLLFPVLCQRWDWVEIKRRLVILTSYEQLLFVVNIISFFTISWYRIKDVVKSSKQIDKIMRSRERYVSRFISFFKLRVVSRCCMLRYLRLPREMYLKFFKIVSTNICI